MKNLRWLLGTTLITLALGCGPKESDKDDQDGGDEQQTDTDPGLPDAPTLTAPTAGAEINDPVTVTGTAEANASINVVVTVAGTQVGALSNLANASGAFSFNVGYSAQAPGTSITIAVTQTTDEGTSAATSVLVEQAAPSLLPPPPTITAPTANALVNSPLSVTGTAQPGATVDVVLNGPGVSVSEQVTATSGGGFAASLSYTAPSNYAELTVLVTQTDEIGTSNPTSLSLLQAPTTVPAALIFTEPEADDIVGPTFAAIGTGEPNTTVTLSVEDSDGNELWSGGGTVDTHGNFGVNVGIEELATPGSTLTLTGRLTNGIGDSTGTTVSLTQGITTPIINTPAPDAQLGGAVRVTGFGYPGAVVLISVKDSNDEDALEGLVETVVGADGNFAVVVDLTSTDPSDTYTLEAFQAFFANETNYGSDVVTRSFTRHQPLAVTFGVSQIDGATDGTAVYARIYEDINAPIPEPLLTVQLPDAEPGEDYLTFNQSIQLWPGNFIMYLFRDNNDDSRPTLGTDPQVSTPIEITTNGIALSNLALEQFSTSFPHFQSLNAFTVSESNEPWPARQGGVCGGFTMRLEAFADSWDTSGLSPRVRLPNNTYVTLLNDGGCGNEDNEGNNENNSYDDSSNDRTFSYGIQAPDESAVGNYVFFYSSFGFIHESVDNVDHVVRLSRSIYLNGDGAHGGSPISSATPTFSWNAAAEGVVYYRLTVGTASGGQRLDTWVLGSEGTSFTPEEPVFLVGEGEIDEDTVAWVNLSAYDAPYGDDFDAAAYAPSQSLIVDSDGDHTVWIEGELTNRTSIDAPFFVVASSDGSDQASVYLSSGSTSYGIAVLESDTCGEHGFVRATLDVDGTGESYSYGNRSHSTEISRVDTCEQTEFDFTFNPELRLVSPAPGETVDETPTFSWEDYTVTYFAATGEALPQGNNFVYIFFAGPADSNGLPPIIWVTPSTATSIDFEDIDPSFVDVIEFRTGGAFSSDTELQDGGARWGVFAVDCIFPVGPELEEQFYTCLDETLESGAQNAFAFSQERPLDVVGPL